MPKFSKKSLERLEQCHPDIQRLMHEVIKYTDFTVLCGHRDRREQEEAVAQRRSKVHFPNSKHNSLPSQAIDIAPYPIDWNDFQKFEELYRVVKKCAEFLDISIRWGGDWNGNGDWRDEKFVDMPHYELKEQK